MRTLRYGRGCQGRAGGRGLGLFNFALRADWGRESGEVADIHVCQRSDEYLVGHFTGARTAGRKRRDTVSWWRNGNFLQLVPCGTASFFRPHILGREVEEWSAADANARRSIMSGVHVLVGFTTA